MIPTEFIAAVGGHPVVAQLLWQRGIRTAQQARAFLHPDAYTPAPPSDLPDMDKAVARLLRAIAQGERIRVWGDLDADGQTSTSALLLGLRGCGANADYTIPSRASNGRGLSKAGISRAREEGVQLIVTCDCGSTDVAEAAYARQLGIDLIITDHHDLGETLPDAVALINPHRLPADHALAHLPGVGVAYMLVLGLAEAMGSGGAGEKGGKGEGEKGGGGAEGKGGGGEEEQEDGMQSPISNLQSPTTNPPFTPSPLRPFALPPLRPIPPSPLLPFSPSALLDLVAVGIVADVAQLRGDARYLLQRGLEQLRTQPRTGVRAMLRAVNTDPAGVNEETISYQIGPRLNAAGRLDDAEVCVELLTTDDPARAAALAARLEALNIERRELQRATEDEAFRMLANDHAITRQPVIVLVSPNWNSSVLGVVASAIANRYEKPAVVISVRPGEMGRGSARSVHGLDINAAIHAQGLVESGGGHPMAAGFAIRSENVPALREGLIRYAQAQPPAPVTAELPFDAVIAWQDVTPQLCDDLERLAPFGSGNPRPLLKTPRLKPVRTEPLGSHENRHIAVFFSDESGLINRVIYWRGAGQMLPNECDLVFSVHRDWYKGKQRLQLQLARMDPASEDEATSAARFTIVDRREATDRIAALRQLIGEYGAQALQVWDEIASANTPAEGATERYSRIQLVHKPVLVIWSAPPGPRELAAGLERAQPQIVVLLTTPTLPGQDDPAGVLQQVAGMRRVAERRGDSLDDTDVLIRMAARIGQRDESLSAALAVLRATDVGDIVVLSRTREHLNYWLAETRAYREYFQVAAADAVLRKSSK